MADKGKTEKTYNINEAAARVAQKLFDKEKDTVKNINKELAKGSHKELTQSRLEALVKTKLSAELLGTKPKHIAFTKEEVDGITAGIVASVGEAEKGKRVAAGNKAIEDQAKAIASRIAKDRAPKKSSIKGIDKIKAEAKRYGSEAGIDREDVNQAIKDIEQSIVDTDSTSKVSKLNLEQSVIHSIVDSAANARKTANNQTVESIKEKLARRAANAKALQFSAKDDKSEGLSEKQEKKLVKLIAKEYEAELTKAGLPTDEVDFKVDAQAIFDNAKVESKSKSMGFAGKAATTVGAVGLIAVAFNRFKAMVSGAEPTPEEQEQGIESKPKSLFSKIANGLTAVVTALGAASLAMDIAQGKGVGDTGKSWVQRVTGGGADKGLQR